MKHNKFLLAGFGMDQSSGLMGYMAAIYDSSTDTPKDPGAVLVVGSFGNYIDQRFSIQDPSLDLEVSCIAH
ncbi:MAG: hypothetical protein Q7U04_09445 [Bacteriovorax sp.]|nr:hypothetical protein [Bacteriovorax sp.]